ncbi:uncharacterized protein LOC135946837 isoform X2 [Cloeon dipterum]|uniref:uncharacterized protein LOC135946837 isoform X2 n=1 Tax=Cloeon dipterum TaxID=197152 RepID=UPI00321FF86F
MDHAHRVGCVVGNFPTVCQDIGNCTSLTPVGSWTWPAKMQLRIRAHIFNIISLSQFILTTSLTASEECYIKSISKVNDPYWSKASLENVCIQNCNSFFSSNMDSISSKPIFREPVFEPLQESVDCFQVTRNVITTCRFKLKGLSLQQFGDLPLLHFGANGASRFEGEKYCRQHGLNFGLEDVKKIDQPNLLRIWAPSLRFAGSNLTCFVFVKKLGTYVMEQEDCRTRNTFACSLPEICHNTFCISNRKKLDSRQSKCFPNCPEPNCNDEPPEKMGYSDGDGVRFEACGRRYVVSKAAMNFSSAAVFCCSKLMDLAGVETETEMNCLFAELTKRGQEKIQMWTSGDSEPCGKSFAWCASREMIDNNALKWNEPLEVGTKGKISVSIGAQSLEFRSEGEKTFKRALCESALQENCTNSRCLNYECSFEKEFAEKTMKGLREKISKDYMLLVGCGMAHIDVNVASFRNSFHGAYKMCCVGAGRLLTIETKEKYDCLQSFFKENGVPKNRYWIGGASLSCPSINRWCNGKDNPLIGNFVNWAKGEPSIDSRKECVYADYDNVTSTLTLGKINCKTPMLFICEHEF